MKLLTSDEQQLLHHRYKRNDLYRQWSPILGRLQRDYVEADPHTLWHQAELLIVRLRGEQAFREQEISPIFNELLADCRMLGAESRNAEQARQTATTVMCIVLTMLMNAVEKGHEEENFDNEPMCIAIMDILSEDKFFQWLMQLFFKRSTGYDGRPVVITPSDPMQERTMTESMDDVAKDEIKQMVERVLDRTKGLKALFKGYWPAWEPLWQDVCADTELMLLMKEKAPRTTLWGMNQKMVCNVTGMFRDATVKTEATVQALSNALDGSTRSYISNHADYNGTNSVFNREQHDKVKQLIENHVLSIKDN